MSDRLTNEKPTRRTPPLAEYADVFLSWSESSHLPKAEFSDFCDGVPTAVLYDEKQIPLRIAEHTIPTDEFTRTRPPSILDRLVKLKGQVPRPGNFDRELASIVHPDARRLVFSIADRIFFSETDAIYDAEQDDTELAVSARVGERVPPDSLPKRLLSDDWNLQAAAWYDDALPQTMEWLRMIREQHLPVKERRVDLPEENIHVRRITIGDVEERDRNRFELDRGVIGLLLYLRNHVWQQRSRPLQLTLFHIASLESEDEQHRLRHSGLEWFAGVPAFAHTALQSIVVLEQSSLGIVAAPDKQTETHLISIGGSGTADTHEAAHIFDQTGTVNETSPQAEGWAVAWEFGFGFEDLKHVIRSSYHYGRPVSRVQIESLLSSNPPERVSVVEQYYLSASFMSFVFEELGIEQFLRFHSLLTSGKLPTSPESFPDCKGSVVASLEMTVRGNDRTAEQLLELYVDRMNSPSP